MSLHLGTVRVSPFGMVWGSCLSQSFRTSGQIMLKPLPLVEPSPGLSSTRLTI